MESLRAMEQEAFQQEVLAEEEQRYLRRQKPLEIRRRRFGKRVWRLHQRLILGGMALLAGAATLYAAIDFLSFSPRFRLASPEQVELLGNRHVSRAAVLELFAADRGRSVLRLPLGERRRALEAIPWVEHARITRVLPDRIRVELVERQPVAFLRLGAGLALIDAHGVILERPREGAFRFPVVTGLSDAVRREERERRMQFFTQFRKEIELARPGADDSVSEVDLSDGADLRVTLAGMPELGAPGVAGQRAVLVHFGDGDFQGKFRVFLENFRQWQASAGRVESVDLRFRRQVVVNPEGRREAPAGERKLGAASRAHE